MKNFWKSHFSSLISKPQKPEFYFVVSSLVEAQRMVADYGGRRLGVAIPTFISTVQYNAIVDLLGRFAINLTLLNPRNNPSVSVTILDAMSDEDVKDYRNLTGASVVIVAISSAAGTGMASKIAAKALERGFVVAQRLHGKRMHAAEAAVDVRAANIPPPVPEPTWNLQGVLSGIFTFGSAFFIFKMVAKIIQDVSRTPASTPSSSSKNSYALQEFSMIYLLAILLCKIR